MRGSAAACGSARILLLLKRRWRRLPMCLATAWTGRSYEFACHEGHNSMPLLLSDACAHERAEEAASR